MRQRWLRSRERRRKSQEIRSSLQRRASCGLPPWVYCFSTMPLHDESTHAFIHSLGLSPHELISAPVSHSQEWFWGLTLQHTSLQGTFHIQTIILPAGFEDKGPYNPCKCFTDLPGHPEVAGCPSMQLSLDSLKGLWSAYLTNSLCTFGAAWLPKGTEPRAFQMPGLGSIGSLSSLIRKHV